VIVGIVLGAGTSRRLGRPKQTLEFGGRPLLAHVVAEVEAAASLDRVVVVVGDTLPTLIVATDRTVVVRNQQPSEGCASSLRVALASSTDAEAVVMLLGDMPGVTGAIVDDVVERYREAPSWAAVTEYDDGLGHPLVFGADAFPELRGLHGDKAVWKIVDREPPDRVSRIRVPGPVPADVDTWDDYEAVYEAFGFDPALRTPRSAATTQLRTAR
jgi:molybdenum cofactor cytidylyltransferase